MLYCSQARPEAPCCPSTKSSMEEPQAASLLRPGCGQRGRPPSASTQPEHGHSLSQHLPPFHDFTKISRPSTLEKVRKFTALWKKFGLSTIHRGMRTFCPDQPIVSPIAWHLISSDPPRQRGLRASPTFGARLWKPAHNKIDGEAQ